MLNEYIIEPKFTLFEYFVFAEYILEWVESQVFRESTELKMQSPLHPGILIYFYNVQINSLSVSLSIVFNSSLV
jgi:hypothetical protein